jgi:pimeloyl-ACP methyl ester carboxylesterase
LAVFREITSKDGVAISCRRSGAGRPLLLVHGTTADHHSWEPITPLLASHCTIFAMDRRGRGASGDSPEYGLEREVEDIVVVVEAIGEPVALLGHSYGALCSLEATLLTAQIGRLILYEPGIVTGIPLYPPGVPERMQGLIDRGELEAAMEVLFREVVRMPEHELAAYRQSPLWAARLPLAATIPREMAAELAYHFDAARFASLQTPTMLLQGGDSPPVLRQATELVAAALPNSRIVVLPGQQHIAYRTDPELFAHEALNFIMGVNQEKQYGSDNT